MRTTPPAQRGSKVADPRPGGPPPDPPGDPPSAWPALNGSQRARFPTSCPTIPSISATQASASAMAPTRLRTSAPSPTPIAAFQAMLPPIVVHIAEFDQPNGAPLSAHQLAAAARPTALQTTPDRAPRTVYTASLAVMTWRRAGVLRYVSMIVLCLCSPATARIPNTRVNRDVSPTWASAPLCAVGLFRSPLDRTRPLTPASTSSGAAARSSQGPRTVPSFRISVLMRVFIHRLLCDVCGDRG